MLNRFLDGFINNCNWMREDDNIPDYSINVMMNVKNAVIVTHICLSMIRVISMSLLIKSTNNFPQNIKCNLQMI